MATYKEIHGIKVQYRDSDATAIEGDVWYNSSTGKLKMYASVGSWASGNAINTSRKQMGAAGIFTAGLIFAGETSGFEDASEEFNGSSWTEGDDCNTTGSNLMGCGTQTAALRAGGYNGSYLNKTEEYNGSSWTEVNNMPHNHDSHTGSFGTQTAGLAVTGNQSPGPSTKVGVFEYDGTKWTTGTSVNTAKEAAGGFGTSTTGMIASNNQGTEQWNGSAWTEGADNNTVRYLYGGASGASGTDGMIFGGSGTEAETETWNGTSWTEVADLATARTAGGVGNSSSTAVAAGGGPSIQTTSEEWSYAATAETIAFD